MALDIRLHKGLLITYHLHVIRIFDLVSLTLTDSHQLIAGYSPISLISLNAGIDELSIIRKNQMKIEWIRLKINVKDKRVQLPAFRVEGDEAYVINDIDFNKHFFALAT